MGTPGTFDDFLEHYGVKGMKWGVRKESGPSLSTRIENRRQAKFDAKKGELVLSKACKNGTEISVYKANPSKLQTAMAKRFKTSQESLDSFHEFVFADKNGRKIGEASFTQTSKTSYDLEWIGIKKDARSNGYARAALDGVISHAKDNGIRDLNLIATGMGRPLYESLGFQHQGDHYYQLKLDSQAKHAFSDSDLETLLDRMVENVNQDESLNELNHTFDGFLEHYGVKGMKWGVRRTDAQLARAAGRPKPEPSADAKRVSNLRSKKTYSLTNAELKAINERLNLEQNYMRLGGPKGTKFKRMGKKFINNAFKKEFANVTKDPLTMTTADLKRTASYEVGSKLLEEYKKRR